MYFGEMKMDEYSNSEIVLKKLIKDELVFDELQDALHFATHSIDNGDNLIVFKQTDGKYITIKEINREIPILLGFELIAGFDAVLYIHEKNDDAIADLDEFNSMKNDIS